MFPRLTNLFSQSLLKTETQSTTQYENDVSDYTAVGWPVNVKRFRSLRKLYIA